MARRPLGCAGRQRDTRAVAARAGKPVPRTRKISRQVPDDGNDHGTSTAPVLDRGGYRGRRRLEACHGFVVASPEYNASMPGTLKNAIDRVSRYESQPLNERHGLLMSASPSMGGATAACGRCAFRLSTSARGTTTSRTPSTGLPRRNARSSSGRSVSPTSAPSPTHRIPSG